jgi:hypothetical protein
MEHAYGPKQRGDGEQTGVQCDKYDKKVKDI